ncbi:MAG: hypothetical protein H6810_08625 [Phycisphaeraceae bacterium]|nr:MAG: hypothetical protein H6810_08625 [Phycisphaeraceae bacterium]
MSRTQAGVPAALTVLLTLAACGVDAGHRGIAGPRRLDGRPITLVDPNPPDPNRPIADLSNPDAAVRGETASRTLDTRTFPIQRQVTGPFLGADREEPFEVDAHLQPPMAHEQGPTPEKVPFGTTREGAAVLPGSITQFSGLDRTGWVPPDPTLAVGPNHVLITVNQTIAWYTKAGTLQFSAILGSQGNPGFFEPIGAGTFTFDPKCFYDYDTNRYVVLALETYSNSAYITIAVSDDDDPNGIWHAYRTDAVLEADGTTFWWDYPGFGYDQQGYYVTGNLFGLNQDGWGGAGFRCFRKAPLLTGDPAVYFTLRGPGAGSVQCVDNFDAAGAAYFVEVESDFALRVHAISNPVTEPTKDSYRVPVGTFSGASGAPVLGGGTLSVVDARIMNAQVRNGTLYTTHHVSVGGVAKPRWYQISLNGWPATSIPTLTQAGIADPGYGISGFFPAIFSNGGGNVGMVFGTSSPDLAAGVVVTGRLATDPPGTMAEPVLVRRSPIGGTNGRWGDYFDITTDPTDDTTFWCISQTDEPGIGWDTRIASFRLGEPCLADLVEPYGTLDLLDINAFVVGFQIHSSQVDFAEPFGVWDLGDIAAFIESFQAGCP